MVDAVKATSHVGIKNKLALIPNIIKDRFNRIVLGPSWSEPVTIRLKSGFPFRFQGSFGYRLFCTVPYGWDA